MNGKNATGDIGNTEAHGVGANRRLAPESTGDTGNTEAHGVGANGRSPLQGKRIVMTRAQAQANALADQIRARGGEPVEFPTIEFAPLADFGEIDAALARVGEYDWVVFTSVNGVRGVAERLGALNRDMGVFRGRKLAAIGPATAQALQALGLHVDFIPTKFLGAQIAVELPVEPRQRVLLLRADIASDVLARALVARGVQVTNIDAYRTVMPSLPDVNLDRADAITFTSSSTVRNFVALLNGHYAALLARLAIFCIGPVTAGTAQELGLRVDAVATEHTIDGLVRAMAEYYRKG
ncbi:MAG: uroporphyrinogen-III synthase [Anaerolineae bacterium]